MSPSNSLQRIHIDTITSTGHLDARQRRTTGLITTLFTLVLLVAPLVLLSGCGAMVGAGSAKVSSYIEDLVGIVWSGI